MKEPDRWIDNLPQQKPKWVWALFFLVLLLLVVPLVMTVFALFS